MRTTIACKKEDVKKVQAILAENNVSYTEQPGITETIFVMDIDEETRQKLSGAFTRENIKDGAVKILCGTVKVAKAVVGTAVIDIGIPVAKTVASAAVAGAGIGVRAGIEGTCGVFNSTVDEIKETRQKLKKSNDYIKAKENIGSAWKSAKNLFGISTGGIKME